MSEPSSVYITQVEISNILGIKFVDIPLHRGVNLFTGRNGQGKSSVLKAIKAVVGGTKNSPKRALREGARRGHAKVKLSDLRTVIGNWNADNERRLTLLDANGNEIKSPQKQLDALIGELTFNPLEFLDADEKRQAEIYRQLGGLNFDDMDAKRLKLYNERREVNRAMERENGVVNAMPFHPGMPAAEISYPKLTEELNECHKLNAANDKIRHAELKATAGHQDALKKHTKAVADVAKLREALRAAEAAEAETLVDVQAKFNAAEDARAAAANLTTPDIGAVQKRIAESSDINEKIRANANRSAAMDRVKDLEEEAQALTDQIDDIDAERRAKLKAAEDNMPVKGLTMEGKLMLWKGRPLDQASGAEQIEFCVEVGAALNPGLNTIWIDDAEKMNADRLQLLAEKSMAMGIQVLVAKATEGDGEEGSIVMEDGEVKGWRSRDPNIDDGPSEMPASDADEFPMFDD